MKRLVIALLVLNATLWGSYSPGYGDQVSRLEGNHPGEAEQRLVVGNADANQPLTMEIRLKPRNLARLDQLLAEIQDPASPNYHSFLKPGEFDREFGPRQPDIDAVANWLRGEGFTIASTSGSVQFTGSVVQAERTFSVHIAKLSAVEYSNLEDPEVPTQLAPLIGYIGGLDNLMHSEPVLKIPAGSKALRTIAPPGHKLSRRKALSNIAVGASALAQDVIINDGEAYGDADMRNTYDVPADFQLGPGDCIAIVGTSDIVTAALTTFTNQFSDLPAIDLTQKLVGSDPGTNGDDVEAYLDIEWSHVMAPGAPQVFYKGASLVSDISKAVSDDTCKVISISFEFCGSPNSFYTGTLDPLFAKAASQGQSVFVSTGDHGAAGSVDVNNKCVSGSSRTVSEMAADPNVTAVGGTQILHPNYDQNGIDQGYPVETVWNDQEDGSSGGGATGGGASQIFAKPKYQTGPGVPNDSKRDTPDVALLGGSPAVFIGSNSGSNGVLICCIDGTSLAAPLWAGVGKDLEAQLGPLGALNTTIYELARQQYGTPGTDNGFHDITSGNNSFGGVQGFSAATAYDQASGWGSIDFEVFAAAVKNGQSAPSTSMVATPGQISFGNLDASSSSKAHKVSIANKGSVNATMGTVSVAAPFQIAPGTDLCSGQSVAPKKSCTVMVLFSPSMPVASSGSLSAPYNGGSATVSLSGNGTVVSLKAPTLVSFSPVAVGSSGAQKAIAISNLSATATVQIGTAVLHGPFIKGSTDSCSNTSLKPKGKCTIGVEFQPTSPTTTAGSLGLTFTYGVNAGTPLAVSLVGKIK